MSKFPIEWHRQCLDNTAKSITREEAQLIRQQERVASMRKDYEAREAQYAEALSRKVDAYDPDKFGVKVSKK